MHVGYIDHEQRFSLAGVKQISWPSEQVMNFIRDNTELPNELQQFYQALLEQRLAYLLLLQMRGYSIEVQEIRRLREDLLKLDRPDSEADADSLHYAVCELQGVFALIDGMEEARRRGVKATLFVHGPTKLRMRPEKNHQRPHFHLEYKQEHSASYAIDTLECLAGEMPRKYEEIILAWAEEHQLDLLATWSAMSAGEDVRELIVGGKEE